jgi:hypothetical protein
MSYRAGLINGKLTVTRGENGGTLVTCVTTPGIEDNARPTTDESRSQS